MLITSRFSSPNTMRRQFMNVPNIKVNRFWVMKTNRLPFASGSTKSRFLPQILFNTNICAASFLGGRKLWLSPIWEHFANSLFNGKICLQVISRRKLKSRGLISWRCQKWFDVSRNVREHGRDAISDQPLSCPLQIQMLILAIADN